MLDLRWEHFSCLIFMFGTPFYRLVGKGEGGPCVSKLREEPNDAIVCYMHFLVLWHTLNGPY